MKKGIRKTSNFIVKIFSIALIITLIVFSSIITIGIYSQKSKVFDTSFLKVENKEEIKAASASSGKFGSCNWSISNGVLTIQKGTLGKMTKSGQSPWAGNTSITSVKINSGVKADDGLYGMFQNCTGLKTANLSALDTSDAKTFANMFNNCSNLTTVNLSGCNTSKVTDMSYMFGLCVRLTSITFGSSFNTSNVTNMQGMFNVCHSLKTLDVSKFNTAKVTDMKHMFWKCWSLTLLDISNFDTSKVTDNSEVLEYVTAFKLGAKTRFYKKYGGALGKGTWKKDNKTLYNVNGIYSLMEKGTQAGTYKRVSEVSDLVTVNQQVKYKIEKIKNDKMPTPSGSSSFSSSGNVLYLKVHNWNKTGTKTISGSCTVKFPSAVTDVSGNKYTLAVTVSNVKFTGVDGSGGSPYASGNQMALYKEEFFLLRMG